MISFKHPRGWQWDWRVKVWRADRLAQLEDWASRHPEFMTPTHCQKLERVRAEYDQAERLIIQHCTGGRELVVEEFGHLSHAWRLNEKTLIDAAERLYHNGLFGYDYAGPTKTGAWWHWYYPITNEAKIFASEDKQNGENRNGEHNADTTQSGAGRNKSAPAAGVDRTGLDL